MLWNTHTHTQHFCLCFYIINTIMVIFGNYDTDFDSFVIFGASILVLKNKIKTINHLKNKIK